MQLAGITLYLDTLNYALLVITVDENNNPVIELQKEVKQIHESLANKTFMFVTHDINEAFFLGQRVIIMHEGRIEQFATPGEIISHPATPFVKELLGTVQQNQELWRQYHD